MKLINLAGALAVAAIPVPIIASELPDAIAVPGAIAIATISAQGAQVYECKAGTTGEPGWQFREPIATLVENGRTVGQHYAGPNWELIDGSTVTGKASARAPGATAQDIPLLKLEVTAWRGSGRLSDVSTIQRINTKGGVAVGPCTTPGALLSVPYSADYVFYKKARWSRIDGIRP